MHDNSPLTDYQSVRQLAIRSLFEIFEQFSEGTVIVDRDANIVWINQRYAQRFGLDEAEQAVGRPVESVIPGSLMREVMVNGQWVVRERRHALEEQSAGEFAGVLRELLG